MTKDIMYKYLGVLLYFGVLISCESQPELSTESSRNERIRAISEEYSLPKNDYDIKAIYEKYKNDEDEEIRFANEIFYVKFNTKRWPNRRIANMDSIIKDQKFPYRTTINRFHCYLLLSKLYHYSREHQISLEYLKKANQELYDGHNDYWYEKQQLQEMLRSFIKEINSDKNDKINYYVEQTKEYKNTGQKVKYTRACHNIGAVAHSVGNYDLAIKYCNLALQDAHSVKVANLTSSIYSILATCYANKGDLDATEQIIEKVNALHQQKEISDEEYNIFNVYIFEFKKNKLSQEEFQKQFNTLYNKFEDVCKYRYIHSCLNTYAVEYYEDRNKLNPQKPYLQKNLSFCEDCGNRDYYFNDLYKNTLEKLISINIKEGKTENLSNWYSKIKELEKNEKEAKDIISDFLEFYTEYEVSYIDDKLNDQKEIVENSQKINTLYSLLLILSIISIAMIMYFFFKNLKFQKHIKANNTVLEEKNQTIQEQHDNMKILVDVLRESNENLENFARAAAHDIKSPIATINNAIGFISNKYKKYIEKEDEDILKYVNNSTKHLDQMINVLLQYSTSQKNRIKNSEVDTELVVKRCLRNLSIEINKHNANIEVNYPLSNVLGKETLIEQVFMNIIQNAIKFHKKNVPPKVKIYEKIEDDWVVFTIEDNGIGIPSSELNNVFNSFTKLHSFKEFEGSGIGLSTTKRIIEELGGKIWVVSEEGVGSKFSFTLLISK